MSDADVVAAIDGHLAGFVAGARARSLTGSVHLHCTDADGEWMLERGGDGAVLLDRRHAKGDCAVRGTATALLALVGGAGSLDGLEVFGDTAVAEGFAAALRVD